ncbi:MAG: DUF4116 domain-containing protein [Deltaproteobacteria bacterium]|nr:DUF4116 domain-containing protein [Deltaproteobacteria bacterium]
MRVWKTPSPSPKTLPVSNHKTPARDLESDSAKAPADVFEPAPSRHELPVPGVATAESAAAAEAGGFWSLPPGLPAEARKALSDLRSHPEAVLTLAPALQQNPTFIYAAVRSEPQILLFLPYFSPQHQRDPDLALAAIRAHSEAIRYVDPVLLSDRDFVRKAIAENPWCFAAAPEPFRADKALVAELVEKSGFLLSDAASSLRDDEELVRAAIKSTPTVMCEMRLPDEVAHDKVAMLGVAEKCGMLIAVMEPALRADREIALAAVRQEGLALEHTDHRSDAEICANAVLENPAAIAFISSDLLHSPDFVMRLCAADERATLFLKKTGAPPSCIDNVLASHPELEERRAELAGRLERTGIDFPERFVSRATLEEVLRNREALDPADPRPIAVYVFPKEDWNNAFADDNLAALTKHYRVMYYEARSETDFIDALKGATSSKPAEVLVIGGHGTASMTAFGAGDPAQEGGWSPAHEEAYLDFTDARQMKNAQIAECVAPGAKVILKSCSTGEGQDSQTNVANIVSTVFPHADIYAPLVSDNNTLQVDAEGVLQDPGYWRGPYFTYHVRGTGGNQPVNQ